MREYLKWFFEAFDYPEEAREALLSAYDAIYADETAGKRFDEILRRYEDDINCDMTAAMEDMKALCGAVSVNEYTGGVLHFICLSRMLREYYQREGIDETIWHTSMCDLKYKVIECKMVYGVWGSFVCSWFIGFFQLTRFGFSKLQFELIPFQKSYEKNGVVLTPESQVINVHIPRTGGRLDGESRKKAYEQAAAFFRERYQLDQIVFVCSSWLLFPRHLEVLSPEANLCGFIKEFDRIDEGLYADYSHVWRLFDMEYKGDVDQLPQDTTLRRAYADWIRKGEKLGWARGVYVYSV